MKTKKWLNEDLIKNYFDQQIEQNRKYNLISNNRENRDLLPVIKNSQKVPLTGSVAISLAIAILFVISIVNFPMAESNIHKNWLENFDKNVITFEAIMQNKD